MTKLINIPKKYWLPTLTMIVMLFSSASFAGGSIKGITKVEGTEFEVGEQFMVQYILKATGKRLSGNLKISGDNFGDLEIIGQNSSESSRNINSKITHELTYQYYFQSSEPGTVNIPGIIFILNGKQYPCQSKKIRITKPRNDLSISGDYNLVLKPNKTEVYVGEPIRYDLIWYSAIRAEKLEFSEIPKFDGFVKSTFDSESQKRIKTINGKKYLTRKRASFLLNPINSGKITIPSVKADLYIPKRQGWRTVLQPKTLSTGSQFLKVKPLPTPPNNKIKGAAVGAFTIKTILDKSELEVDDALTVRIKFNGVGNLNNISDLNIVFPTAFEALPPTVKNNITTDKDGIRGSKTFEFVAIPRQPGTFKIPSIEVWAFNPKTGKYYSMKSDPLTVKVTGTGTGDATPYVSSNGGNDVELQGSDIRYLNNINSLSTGDSSSFTYSALQFVLLFLALGGFVAGTFIFKEKSYSKNEVKSNKKAKANKVAQKYLKDAQKELNGDKNKFYELVDEAINKYLLGKLMIEQSQLKKEIITQELSKHNVSTQLIDQTIKISNDCKMARFSPMILPPNEMFIEAEKVINELENQLK